MPDFNEVRKKLSIAIIKRADTFDMGKTEALKVAKNFFLGAAELAEAINEGQLSGELKSSYTIVVERGVGLVYKWADIKMPAPDTQEAA